MNRKLPGFVTAHYTLLVRSFFFILGCVAAWWGIVAFSVFWQQSSAERVASRIIAGYAFRANILGQQLPIIERSAYCRPAAVQSAAIIRLRMVETAISNREHIVESLDSLGNAVRRSLSCAPADPFLWLVLWWIENTQNGFRLDDLQYLRMSYRLGPNEGWIALKRSRLAFSIFEQLPDDLTEDAMNEFIGLLRSQLYGQAVEILTGPAWHVRNVVLDRLKDLPRRTRENFAKALNAQGYDDLVVPGIEINQDRSKKLELRF
jgi:hypothetical protein